MIGWLLDTDVLSAFAPGRASVAPEAAAWFEDHTDALYLSAVTAAEIEAGVARLRRTRALRRADALGEWFERMLDLYADRILPFDLAAARVAGALSDAALVRGRHPGFADVAIASIAKSRGLVILTVNLRHFAPLEIEAVNPFALG